jgi:hypothetical protein
MVIQAIYGRWCKYLELNIRVILTDQSTTQLHSYVTPIMQGYIQISSLDLPKDNSAMQDDSAEPVDYIVISRRSRDRAGLRYQRRGVDDEAHVANFVETEVITRVQVSSSACTIPPSLSLLRGTE